MLRENQSLNIVRKGFFFPMSIRSVKFASDAKVASYEYAGTSWAEHERVKWYWKINVSGIFASASGRKKPEYYVSRLRQTNDNKPWTFIHPTLGSFKCIMKSLSIEISWDETETIGRDNLRTNYSFSFELWEHTEPNAVKAQSKVEKLFPAPNVRPPTDSYKISLAYKTCTQLYNAIIDKKIFPWVDPIKNKSRLAYPYDLRKCAYDRWVANPNGEPSKSASNKNQKTYTVKWGDTGIWISSKLWISFTDLFNANKGRNVRNNARSDQWTKWKNANKLYPWDVLLIPL